MNRKSTELGETIRTLRVARNMTKAELSEAAGISESHLNKIENGFRNPGIKTYQKIMNILGSPIVLWDENNIKGKCFARSQEIILLCSDNQAQFLLEIMECMLKNVSLISSDV